MACLPRRLYSHANFPFHQTSAKPRSERAARPAPAESVETDFSKVYSAPVLSTSAGLG